MESRIYREQGRSHPGWPVHAPQPLHTLHDPYNLCSPLFCYVPGVWSVEGHCNQTPHMQYRQQQLKSIKSKTPNVLRTLTCQYVRKFWSQALNRPMERESTAAVSRPVTRKVRPPLVFTNLEPPHVDKGGPNSKTNILTA